PDRLSDLILKSGVDMMMVTPGRMELLLSDSRGPACLAAMREIGMGGDSLPDALLARVQECTAGRITNFYGPTEVTICATCCDVTHVKEANIGRPMSDVKTYILDEHKNPLAVGMPGELYIGGRGIARGYMNRPELTKERFIPSPFDENELLYRSGDLVRWFPKGEIKFIGRIDQQVKIRGFRIELGEIQSSLLKIPGVKSCAVIDRQSPEGRKFLCAYLVGEDIPTRREMVAQLSKELPSYMIPSYFMQVSALPFNASGKIARRELPDPLLADEGLLQDDFVPPETATERQLAAIWSQVLKGAPAGREDSFFEIGGDSLTVLMMTARVSQTFHVELALEDVYKAPTLKECALLIEQAEERFQRPILPVPARRGGIYPASSVQKRMWILSQNSEAAIAYIIAVAFSFEKGLDIPRLKAALEQLAARHDALRTSLRLQGQKLVQVVARRVEVKIGRHTATEQGLKKALREKVVPMDLASPPLWKADVISTPKRDALLLQFHHSICDQRTLEVLLEDLSRIYDGQLCPEKTLEYKDYTGWQ
ncbi:MAG: AMP-binding protein, partial [Christensenellaceae bacterium]|nr:AMP-binding protein [Christensenellaceae bacterium]